MFKIAFGLLKLGIFGLLVLVTGTWIEWDGKSAADHVKGHVSRIKKDGVVESFKELARKGRKEAAPAVREATQKIRKGIQDNLEGEGELLVSERRKLRQLIRELNQSSD